MAYLPLPDDIKGRGQAAIDVLGGRMGKSLAALLQQAVIIAAGGDIMHGAGVIAVMYMGITVAWVTAINGVASRMPPKMLKRRAAGGAADRS